MAERLVPLGEMGWFAARMKNHSFHFAKTLWRNPHHYTLLRHWESEEDFYKCVEFIQRYGYGEMFPPGPRGLPYTLFNVNGYKYWSMTNENGHPMIINRKTVSYKTDFCVVAEDYDGMFSSEPYRRETREAMELVGDCSGVRVLDIGAGTGAFLDIHGGSVAPEDYVALEPSKAMSDKLIAKHPAFAGSVVNVGFEDFCDGSFDVVVSMFGSPSYIRPPYIQRIPEMLTTGGRYLLMFFQDGYEPVSCAGGHESHHFQTSEFLSYLKTYSEERFNNFSVIEGPSKK